MKKSKPQLVWRFHNWEATLEIPEREVVLRGNWASVMFWGGVPGAPMAKTMIAFMPEQDVAAFREVLDDILSEIAEIKAVALEEDDEVRP